MPDLSTARQGPLDGLAQTTPACAAATLRAAPPMARFILRCRPDGVERAGQAIGVRIPQSPCRASRTADRTVLWLGPDEWLLLAPQARREEIADRLSAAMGPAPHSLVDVSHRNAALEIEGPQSATLLNHGCPLDLSPEAFPAGACTRTLLAKAEIVLWRIGTERFWIETGRSFAPYLWGLLAEARKEFEP